MNDKDWTIMLISWGVGFTVGVLLMYFTFFPLESTYTVKCGIMNCELKQMANYHNDTMTDCIQNMLRYCPSSELRIVKNG